MKLRTFPVLSTAILLISLCIPVVAQLRSSEEWTRKAISAFEQGGFLYTASLRESQVSNKQTCQFVITRQKKTSQPTEVFAQADDSCDWKRLASLNGGRLQGFVLWMDHPDYWFGKTRVIALVNGTFDTVYDVDLPSEVVDIDGDGFPEIIASKWPDGDGVPTTSTIYVWNGKKYVSLMRIPWTERLSGKAIKAVSASAARFRKQFKQSASLADRSQ